MSLPQPAPPLPFGVTEIAIAAARRAGDVLAERYVGAPVPWAGRARLDGLPAAADRAAAAAIRDVLAERRPEDALTLPGVPRPAPTALQWVARPLDGGANFALGIPLWCVSVACEDAAGTVAAAIVDPLRGELFAAGRDGPIRIEGSAGHERADALADAVLGGDVAGQGEAAAKRAGKVHRRLVSRVGRRRVLGSAALELAWTAAGRLDLWYAERQLRVGELEAGLLLCRRAGLRVHRLPPLKPTLEPRVLAAPDALAAEALALVGPSAGERRRAALGAEKALRRRA